MYTFHLNRDAVQRHSVEMTHGWLSAHTAEGGGFMPRYCIEFWRDHFYVRPAILSVHRRASSVDFDRCARIARYLNTRRLRSAA